jgi:hypothetical protein
MKIQYSLNAFCHNLKYINATALVFGYVVLSGVTRLLCKKVHEVDN